jgi:tetratricopeptide (TPR) repeat protein
MRVGKLDAAREPLLSAYRNRVAEQGENADDTAISQIALAELDRRSGQPERAAERLESIAATVPRLGGVERAEYLRQRGLLRLQHGERETAIADFETAENAVREALGDTDPRTWLARLDRAEALTARPATRAAGAALAIDIRAHVRGALAPASPVLAQIERLASAR